MQQNGEEIVKQMMKRGWAIGLLSLGLVSGAWCETGLAQEPPAGVTVRVGDQERPSITGRFVVQPPEEEPTLPPVIVEPPEESPATTTPVESDAPVYPGFPSLSEQLFGSTGGGFGQSTGILRSSARSLFETPTAATITRREEILEKQAPNMFYALQNEVGVLMQSTAAGQASPFIRGLTGQQVLILIDGVRLNNSIFRFGPNQYFNTIDPGMVEQIEVLRGQGSVLWGSDAIGGAINIVTRSPDVHWGRYHGNYSGTDFTQYFNTADISPYSRINVEGWVGNMGALAGGSFLNVRDLDTGYSGFSRQPGTNYQQWAGDIKFHYLISEREMLTVAMQHFQQDDLPRSDRYPGYPGDLDNSNTLAKARFFDPQQRDLVYVRYQALDVFGFDSVMATASYHRQRENQKRGVPETRFQETDVETVGFNVVAVKDLDVYGKATIGADWYYDDVDSRFGGTASGPIIPDDAWYERVGAFLNWDVTLTEKLDTVAGVRYEMADLAGTPVVDGNPIYISPSYHDWVGQVGMVYHVNSYVNLVGSISEGFRAPNLDELMANNPNVLQQGQDLPSLGLVPERSINYEVGIKTNFPRLRTQTFVFWMDLQNNIVPISAGANQFKRANQDSYIQGVEFSGEWLLERGWSLYGNFWYTYGRNRVTDAPLSRIPPMQGIAGLRWRDPERHAYFAFYAWLSDRQDRLDPVRDLSDERIPPGGTPGFATLNVRMGRAYGDHNQHRLSLSVENLLDQPYLVHGSGVYGSGITGRFGYQFVY